MPSPHLVLDWLPPESPFGKKVTAPWLLCLAWWMRGTCRKQPPKAWHWLLLAFWSHHGWLSSPWPSDLWCPWAGAACATLLLRQPRDRSQALILLEAGATLPVGQELLKSDRKDCTLMPPSTTAPHPNFLPGFYSCQYSDSVDHLGSCKADIFARPCFPNHWQQ